MYLSRENIGTCRYCGAEEVDRRFGVCFACAMLEDPETKPKYIRWALEAYERREQPEHAKAARERLAKFN